MWESSEKQHTSPQASKFDRFRNWASELFGTKEHEKVDIQNSTHEEQLKLLREIRDKNQYAKILRIMPQLRKGFEQDNSAKETGKSALLIQLPSGQYQNFTFDHSKMGIHPEGVMLKGQENLRGVIYPVEWGEITIGRIGDFNGYNTQFRVTYKGLGDQTKPLILAYQYAAETPKYRVLAKRVVELKAEIKKIELNDSEYVRNIEEHKEKIGKIREARKRRDIEKEISRLRRARDTNIHKLSHIRWELLNTERELIGIPQYSKNIVYTPYSESIDTPEMRSAWAAYLSKTVRNTWWENTRAQAIVRGIDSQVQRKSTDESGPKIAKSTLSEVLDPRVGIVLAIVERMDFVQYLDAKGGLRPEYKGIMEAQIRSTLTIFGANRETTSIHHYNSTSKATGIAQITPMAHRLILDRYRETILPEGDYGNELNIAGRDPVQSLRFMQVHLYDQISVQTPSWIKTDWKNMRQSREKMFWYYGLLAAGYNGDMTRIKREAFGKSNLPEVLNYSNVIANVSENKETLTYVLKFRYVWEYLERNHKEVFGPEQSIVKK